MKVLNCVLTLLVLCCPAAEVGSAERAAPGGESLLLNLRSRVETAPGSGRYHVAITRAKWQAAKTAIVICDMWDDHYCRASARRVAEMAPRMNEVVSAAREKGVLVIHCPSGCTDIYKDTPQRKLAQSAPKIDTKIPLKGWCYLDEQHEAQLPIDDSVPCDDENPRERRRFYSRQIDAIGIRDGDAITDSAEAFYLMKQRGITNVLVMGVHTNMCVLGRPFGIRQMVYQGQNVALVRDLTDSMYNPRMRPMVSHFTGNDLVNEHVERHWSPTVTGADIAGGKEFRFPADKRRDLVIVMAEDEYRTNETLPAFALEHLGHDFRVTLVYANANERNDIPGIELLDEADVVLLSIRRRTLPDAQLRAVRRFVAAGKPLVAIRTSSHAFCLRGQKPENGLDEWPRFDRDVLGCFYQNHHGNKLTVLVRTVSAARRHPVLTGVPHDEFRVFSSLYKSAPLADTATPLLTGRIETNAPEEPVAWTNVTSHGGRVFYTSLGHADDFKLPAFQRLLSNGIRWAAGLPNAAASNDSPEEPSCR